MHALISHKKLCVGIFSRRDCTSDKVLKEETNKLKKDKDVIKMEVINCISRYLLLLLLLQFQAILNEKRIVRVV